MKNTKIIYGFFLFILLLNVVLADKIIAPTSQGSLDINTWGIESIKQNLEYTFVWDVADSNGLLLNNTQTSCTFFLYESGTFSQITSGLANKTPDIYGWYKTIPAGQLSNLAQYNYQIDCFLVSNTSVSGNLVDSFYITPTGYNLDIYHSIVIGILVVIILLLLIFFYSLFIIEKSINMKVIYFNISYLITLSLSFLIWYIFTNFIYVIPFISDLLYYPWFILMILLFPEIIVSISIILISTLNAARTRKLEGMGYGSEEARKMRRK